MNNLDGIREYIRHPASENAKNHLVFPYFSEHFGKAFKRESEAEGADVYIEGRLIVELKTKEDAWLAGFYQALHYAQKGLSFSALCVIAQDFFAVWRYDSLPEKALEFAHRSNPYAAANEVGLRNASRTSTALRKEIEKSAILIYRKREDDLFAKGLIFHTGELDLILRNLDQQRLPVYPRNFIDVINQLEFYFDSPMEAIHCFYAIVGFWDVTSTVSLDESEDYLLVTSAKRRRSSEKVRVRKDRQNGLIEFISKRMVFTNNGTGLTVDYYFSRFDEVIANLTPDYAKHHGIFFTDSNLSKFALWFVRQNFEKRLGDRYIVLDPAGGSGNLVSSWKGHLKRKIVSELEPDLLKMIERRMAYDPQETAAGFTIIPRTAEHRGLNFLDIAAETYFERLKEALRRDESALDKPFAFLLNPPYKNEDDNAEEIAENRADYTIHESIIALTGNDAARERYLAFLAQILRLCECQTQDDPTAKPVVMVFTPTSWLIPRRSYRDFRQIWDSHFKFESGFLVTSNEFFAVKGKWPVAFTIWTWNPDATGNPNEIRLKDYTSVKKDILNVNWLDTLENIDAELKQRIAACGTVNLSKQPPSIVNTIGITSRDFKRTPTQREHNSGLTFGGLPISDPRRRNNKTYGVSDGRYLGLMDDGTPVRIKQDNQGRISSDPNRIWFRLDAPFEGINKARALNAPPDNRGYAAVDVETARALCAWFGIAKSVAGRYPIWANKLDIWQPVIPKNIEDMFYSLCFSYVLAENSAVVTKFEANNPIDGVPEVYLNNPLSPILEDGFWTTTLAPEIRGSDLATTLVGHVHSVYEYWSTHVCRGRTHSDVGLRDQPEFKYFHYSDFVTPHAGLRQIRRYSEIHQDVKLMSLLDDMRVQGTAVLDHIYLLLIREVRYFG